jgi:hypothetical protein
VECEAGRRRYVDESGSAVNEQSLLGRLQQILEMIEGLSGCVEAPDEDWLVRSSRLGQSRSTRSACPRTLKDVDGCFGSRGRTGRKPISRLSRTEGTSASRSGTATSMSAPAAVVRSTSCVRSAPETHRTPSTLPNTAKRVCQPEPLLRRIARTPRGLEPRARKDHPP